MELTQILELLLLGGVLIVGLVNYLKMRSLGKTPDEATKETSETFRQIMSDFQELIRDMSTGLRDSVSQDTFEIALKSIDKLQERITDGIVFEVSLAVEEALKRVDHDPTNDPDYVPPTEGTPETPTNPQG